MSDAGASRAAKRLAARRALGWIGSVLVAGLAVLGWSVLLSQRSPGGASAEDPDAEYRRELHSYLWGIGLALLLTWVPFSLVYWHAAPPFWLFIGIGAFALVQIVVHFRFFLHIRFTKQKMEDLELILFSTLILTLMAGGTIWILTNLAARMH